MTEQTTPAASPEPARQGKRGRKIVLIVFLSLVVLALIGVGALWATTQFTQSKPSNAAAPSVTGVAAGSGGTSVAVDGKTKIGYENTCVGAVQAASNYNTTVNLYKKASDQEFTKLVQQVFATPEATEPFLKNSAYHQEAGTIEQFQDWGGAYKVESCEPRQHATIALYTCNAGYYQGDKYSGRTECLPIRVGLLWVQNDWKLTSLADVQGDQLGLPKTFSRVFPKELPHPPGINKDQWAKITADDDQGPITGWVDFTNAHRS